MTWFDAQEGWIAGGVFEPMLHRIEPGADTETLDDVRYWWAPAPCRAMCIELPSNTDIRGFPLCGKCFPHGLMRRVPQPPV